MRETRNTSWVSLLLASLSTKTSPKSAITSGKEILMVTVKPLYPYIFIEFELCSKEFLFETVRRTIPMIHVYAGTANYVNFLPVV